MRSSESGIPNPESRSITGILLLDKPQRLSSNQALQRVKRLYGARKAGHTGSLDPLATGLLPVCFGEATKIAGLLLGSRKAYRAEVQLGSTTTTDDSEGEILAARPVPDLDVAAIEAVLARFRGRIAQVAPVYSALKQAGTPLYARARRGEAVQAPTREVEVDRLELLGRTGERLDLLVECGSGTYIRSLARDIGEQLGCGAHLVALRRLWVEPFREPAMWTLEQIEARDGPGRDALLLPVEAGLDALPGLRMTAEQARMLEQGRRFRLEGAAAAPLCRATGPGGELVALAEIGADGVVRVRRGFNLPS